MMLYRPTHLLCNARYWYMIQCYRPMRELWNGAVVLRACYGMSGTDLPYDATRSSFGDRASSIGGSVAIQYAVLTFVQRLGDVRYWLDLCDVRY
eukprot:3352718-Rhodomonas_salina.1